MNGIPPFRQNGGTFVYPELHHGGPSALAWTIFALQVLLLLGLAALLASTLTRGRRRPAIAGAPAAAPARRDDPLDVIRMRYARGELTRDDYLQARGDLGGPTDELPET
jgi:uncharacterized membrane protein